MSLSANEKIKLVTRNLQEVLGQAQLEEIMQNRPLKVYWGTATTGKPHIAYFVPVCKIADFLHAGCEVTILFADLHAYLDNMKAPWELLKFRAEYYEKVIKAMLKSIGIDLSKLKFVRGTEYQLSKEYNLDLYRMTSTVSQHDAKKAGAEVVKQVHSPLLSGLLYPCLQALDEHYLDVDAQFGGVDQRKIFTFAEKHLPMLGYGKRIHLMNPMVPGLTGDKMSASEEMSKIDLLDGPDVVKRKLKKAFCEPGNVTNNSVLAFAKHVVFPTLQFRGDGNSSYKVKRFDANGEFSEYSCYEDLEKDYVDMVIHPSDLKASLVDYINELLKPIREEFKLPELQTLVKNAYSPVVHKVEEAAKSNCDIQASPQILDLRIGRIVSTEKHPAANSLLVHHVLVDSGPSRTICSGLRPYIKEADWPKDALCVVLCNVKPVNMRGVESHGIVLAMCRDKPEKVGLLLKPGNGSDVGDPVWIDGFRGGAAFELVINKKQWDILQPHFSIDQENLVRWNGCLMQTSCGGITCDLSHGSIH